MRPSRVLALILVVLAFPGSLWAQDVIYGCVKNNNGQMRIIAAGEKCLPSERPIQWPASADATVPASKPGATQGPLKVEDQNGLMLGYLVSGTYVARLVDDVWVGVPIAPLGFFVSGSASFAAYYTTLGCSGDAYLPVNAIVREGTVMPTAPTATTGCADAGSSCGASVRHSASTRGRIGCIVIAASLHFDVLAKPAYLKAAAPTRAMSSSSWGVLPLTPMAPMTLPSTVSGIPP